MSRPPGPIVLGILAALGEHGPMTREEVASFMECDRSLVSPVLSRLNRRLKTAPKRVHIVAWRQDRSVSRLYLRAVYALGNKPDKKKPPPNRGEAQRRYRARNKAQVSSVFDLGRTGRSRKALVSTKKLKESST